MNIYLFHQASSVEVLWETVKNIVSVYLLILFGDTRSFVLWYENDRWYI